MNKYFSNVNLRKPYSPPGHSGTYNKVIINKKTFGSKYSEVILGEIYPGGEAEEHSHNDCEQGMFILSGTGKFEVGDKTAELGMGHAVFIPIGVSHKVRATGNEPLKFVLFYSPPRE